jgi:peptidyl-prolyl cis-trans isomerase D
MLATIRERAKGWIAWIIVIIISIPFTLWGIGSYLDALNKVVVAEVDGTDIEGNAYQRALDDQRRALQRAMGRRVDPELLNSVALKHQVLEGMIMRHLLIGDVEAQGYRISDAQLREFIHRAAEFQRDGKFDPATYQSALRRAGYTDLQFEEQMRQQNEVYQVRNGFTASAIETKAQIDRLLALRDQKRGFEYLVLKPDHYLQTVKVSPEEVESYYKSNQERFRTPEQVRIEYLTLSVTALAKEMKPSEDELRAAYEGDRSRFVTPEERRASHILIAVPKGASKEDEKAALEKAQALEAKLKAGADFATLAREQSDDSVSAKKGGDLGFVDRGMMDPAFEAALFKLAQGDVSAPVRSAFGYHIIKLTEIRPSTQKPFEEVRDQIARDLARKQAEERFIEQSDTFRDLVYEHPESLAPAAEALNLHTQRSDWFAATGGSGIAADPRIASAAFSDDVLHSGNNSETIEIDPDTLVALHVVDHRESQLKPLEAVQSQIEQTLKLQKARAQAVTQGEGLVAALSAGASLNAKAAELGAQVKSVGLVARSAKGVDRDLLSAVFRAPRPKDDHPSYGGTGLASGGYAVYALEKVVEGDPAKAAEAEIDAVKSTLARRDGLDAFTAYQHGLREHADVKIHEDKL